MKRVIVDTDPGIDDAAAILLALASPELRVEALTCVYGNGTLEQSMRNALIILEAAGRLDIPVCGGCSGPVMGRHTGYAHHVHGEDALGGVVWPDPHGKPQARHAVAELIDRVVACPGEITLIALGPLTNVALALSVEPLLGRSLAEVIVMGGAVRTQGNATEVASYNIYKDPEAAAIVYASEAPVVQVGLDVCNKVLLLDQHMERLRRANTPVTDFLTRITPVHGRFYAEHGMWDDSNVVEQYNDVPPVAYAIDPALFRGRSCHARVSINDDLTRGQTVVDLRAGGDRPNNAHVLLEVDAERLIQMFLSRLIAYERP